MMGEALQVHHASFDEITLKDLMLELRMLFW